MNAAFRALGVLFGAALLVPGLCSLALMVGLGPKMLRQHDVDGLATAGVVSASAFTIGWGGIVLMRRCLDRQF